MIPKLLHILKSKFNFFLNGLFSYQNSCHLGLFIARSAMNWDEFTTSYNEYYTLLQHMQEVKIIYEGKTQVNFLLYAYS